MQETDERPARSDDRQGIQVIARAASVLRALESEPEGLSLGEIATRVDLPRSTVQRIVGALAAEQVLIAATPKGRVKLGPLITRLAGAATLDIAPLVRPVMQHLSRTMQETVDLSVLTGRSATFIEQVPGPHRLAAVSAIGAQFPLHCTANGKALLATMARDRATKLLSGALVSCTERSVTDRDALLVELDTIEQTGLAWDMEEHNEGISAVGTAFVDTLGRLYALSIPAPTTRFVKRRSSLGEALLAARAELVALLGGVRT